LLKQRRQRSGIFHAGCFQPDVFKPLIEPDSADVMKRALAGLALCALPILSASQAAEGLVSIEDEPRHRLAFENAHVRHFDVQLERGYVALYHWHRNDGVFVNIRPSQTTAQDLGGEPKTRPWRAIGETYFIGYSEQPKVHRVSNSGDRVYHVTDTEILKACGTAQSGFSPRRNQALILDNARVFVTRILLHPGESTELAGPCGMLVSLYPAELRLEADAGHETLSLARAGFHWREVREPRRLVNTGRTVFHGVDILVK
jgi:hypothetical protein